jgi:hypothetical protein
MKLLIEIDVENTEWDEGDAEYFVKESRAATGCTVQIGRPVTENMLSIRMVSLHAERFKAWIE